MSALSQRTQDIVEIALADRRAAAELVGAIGTSVQAANVANLGATVNIPATAAVLSTGDTYTDAAVAAAIDGAVGALRTAAEARLDAIEAKLDSLLNSLRSAGILA